MATTIPEVETPAFDDEPRPTGPGPATEVWELVKKVLGPVASLKLTVVLFAMSIFVVLAGTFAQVNADIWEVINQYFRVDRSQIFVDGKFNPSAFFVWIDAQLFMPASFFPWQPKGWEWLGIMFPKGWLIGAVMMVNLFAAHLVRFKVQARGTRLWAGLGVIGVGVIVTTMVILSGSSSAGFQSETIISWDALWHLLEIGLVVLCAAAIYGAVSTQETLLRWLLGLGAVGLMWLFAVMIAQGSDARLDDAYMRILYQLVKGTIAGLVLLAGCIMAFKKRGGIVLLHAGIGLMMVSEVLVGVQAEEAQMRIEEGNSSNFVEDIRTVELAFVTTADDGRQTHTVVPRRLLTEGSVITDDELPVDIEVLKYIPNAEMLRPAQAPEGLDNPATAGVGTERVAAPVRASTGTDSGGAVDAPAAYVTFRVPGGEELGTYLVGTDLDFFNLGENRQTIEVDGKTYEFALRYKRTYKPYVVTLNDIRKDDYVGTDTPRDYSSFIRLQDSESGVDQDVRIWMNNPLRFAGETFYQSNYIAANRIYSGSREWTSLQVVKNTGWMIPYVSCMIVAVAMCAQFGGALMRFLRRQQAPAKSTAETTDETTAHTEPVRRRTKLAADVEEAKDLQFIAKYVPLAVVIVFALYLGSKARMPKAGSEEMDLVAFGNIPVVADGRAKPLDTLARNSLLIISDRQEYVDDDGEKQPAIRWLLDVITESEAAREHRVFKITNLDLQQTLGLERRKGFRYSISEFSEQIPEYLEQLQAAEEVSRSNPEALTFYQRKVLEFATKLKTYKKLQEAFIPPTLPALPDQQTMEADRERAMQQLQLVVQTAMSESTRLEAEQLPLLIAVADESDEEETSEAANWLPFSTALLRAYLQSQLFGETPPVSTQHFNEILLAYERGEADDFNEAVHDYTRELAKTAPADVDLGMTRFESFFNYFAPFYYSAALYLFAFVFTCVSWLVWRRPLNRSALWLIAFTLCVHSFALWARMEISGRPPVTNLYSSAVFIGWAAVLFGLIIERFYGLGIGNLIGSVSGFVTLGIGHFLADSGDTFTVLQAVLDTQFWLATHVVCITLGYATTYVVGLLGLVYIVSGNRLGLISLGLALHMAVWYFLARSTWDHALMAGILTWLFALACIVIGIMSLTGKFEMAMSAGVKRDLIRAIYGTLCFATFFSFVGTVLGGLWADDSWGRFWGWDPKENGALIIVLWNALVLHARWDGMIRDRGLAVLAVLGNIAVSWSWWGVNELGVGLHSYGFTEGVLAALGLFCISQLVMALVGCLPKFLWFGNDGSTSPA